MAGTIVRAPIYVPKPAETTPWAGVPIGISLVLLSALVVAPTFFLGNTKQIIPAQETGWLGEPSTVSNVLLQHPAIPEQTTKPTLQFNYSPEPFWQGQPTPVSILFTLPTTVVLPFANRPWQGPIPDPNWVLGGGNIPEVLLQLPALPPFTVRGTQRFDHIPEPVWTGQSTPVPEAIAVPAPLPFSNPRRFDHFVDIPKFKSVLFTVPLTPQAVLPAFNVRRTSEHVPDPVWVGTPKAVAPIISTPPPVVLPFANRPWQGPIPDPNWVLGGGSVPQALLQFPALPPFTAKGTRRFDHVPEPVWLGEPTPVSIIYTVPPVVAVPPTNARWQGPIPDPNWVMGGGSIPQALLQFNVPNVVPFTVKGNRQFNQFNDPVWRGKSGSSPLSLLLSPLATPSLTIAKTRKFLRPDDTIWTPRNGLRSGSILLSTNNAVRTGTRENEPVYLLDIQAYNPATTLIEIKRFSSVSISSKPSDGNILYDGRMINAGEINRLMFENGGTIGKPVTNVGFFELNNADNALDYLLDYGIGGLPFTLKQLADKDAPLSSATTVFIGTMRGFASVDMSKTIQIRSRDKMELLNQPLLTVRYVGSTNASAATIEGDTTMTGKLKPYSIGFTFQCPAEPANSYDLIYQGAANAQELMLVYDGAVALLNDGDYATIALLRAAVIPAGHYATCFAFGCFRLGALPAKTVTLHMQSSNTSSLTSAGAVAQQILLDGGISLSDIDTASFAALTTSSGNWLVGLFVNDEKTVIDAVCEILNSVAATLISTPLGKFKAVSIGPFPDDFLFNPIFQDNTEVDTFTNDDLAEDSQFVLQASPQAEGDGARVYEVNVGYKRKWQLLSRGDVVDGLDPRLITDAAKEYYQLAQGNLAIKTAQPLSQLMTVQTLFSTSVGAIILGERLFDFYSTRRDFVTFDITIERAGDIDIGDIIKLNPTNGDGDPRYGYGVGGKKVCVISRYDRFGEGRVTITAWG